MQKFLLVQIFMLYSTRSIYKQKDRTKKNGKDRSVMVIWYRGTSPKLGSCQGESVRLPVAIYSDKSKGDLCDKILKLESKVDDLKEEIALLNYNM